MRWSDFKDSLENFLFEFRRQKGGILGLVILIILVFAAVAAPYITYPDVEERWKEVWVENPITAPPVWVNYFVDKSLAPQEVHHLQDLIQEKTELEEVYKLEYEYVYDVPPKDIIIRGFNPLNGNEKYPKITIELVRPDGYTITLIKNKILKNGTVIQIENNPEARKNIITWALENSIAKVTEVEKFQLIAIADVIKIAFSELNPEIFENPTPLNGKYTLIIKMDLPHKNYVIDTSNAEIILNGRSYGLMGTDDKGRDLWAGLVWGTRVSLIVGVSVAVFSVLIGVLYGVISGYFGGWLDEALQRFNDFMYSLPVLPILILLGAYFKGHTTILTIVILLVIFGWVGVAKVARSMALQIKEQEFVEAARALGASSWRIITKHVMPQIAPYAFSQIALSVPGAVMTEAALSFLGLGDPNAVTWGQILYDAQRAGAVVNGYWWWVVPPGLAIALVGLSFVLLGVALDRILNPRLRQL